MGNLDEIKELESNAENQVAVSLHPLSDGKSFFFLIYDDPQFDSLFILFFGTHFVWRWDVQ